MSKPPVTLTRSESQTLLAHLLQHNELYLSKQKRMRNYAMALIMLDAGLRVGELTQLKVWDLYFGDHPITTLILRPEITKTHVERLIPCSERIMDMANTLRQLYHPWKNARVTTYAFTGGTAGKPINVRTVEKVIEHASILSIDRKITPHTLRHTFATRLMQKTNIRVVQRLLGHKSITSTQIYTHPNHEDLTAAIAAIHERSPI